MLQTHMLAALHISPTPHVMPPHAPPPELDVVVPAPLPVVLLVGLPPAPGPVVVVPPAPGLVVVLAALPVVLVLPPVPATVVPPQPTVTSHTRPQAAERNNGNLRTFLLTMNDLLECGCPHRCRALAPTGHKTTTAHTSGLDVDKTAPNVIPARSLPAF
jgi:hypothetical protein